MSHVYVSDAEGHWSPVFLERDAVDLHTLVPPSGASSSHVGAHTARLIAFHCGAAERWAVVAATHASLRINGILLDAIGLRVLAHKDELTLAGAKSLFFSTETLAAVVSFPEVGRAVYCGRCRQEIKPGSPAVKCPGCGVWHDQSDELGCWLFADQCSCCPQRTALDAGLAWVPEE